MCRGYLQLATLLLFMTASDIAAHNGRVAIATTAAVIEVDGDLSDWPETTRYPIDRTEYGADPADEADLTAWFQVAYQVAGNALFVGIEVADESVVVVGKDTAAVWNSQDGCELFLDLAHLRRDSPAIQHAMYGDHHEFFTSTALHTQLDHATVAVQRSASGHSYEWRFDIGAISDGQPLQLGERTAVGFDVTVADRDEDGSFSWMTWGRGIGKLGATHRRGDVIMGAKEKTGELVGRIGWRGRKDAEGKGEVPPRRVLISPVEPESAWVQIETDHSGHYRLDLPPGEYRLQAADLRIGRDLQLGIDVRVRPSRRTDAGDIEVVPEPDKSILVDALFDHLGPADPGASVLVARGGRILHSEGYGLANVEHRVSNGPRTKFRIGSITKQITALAIMQLVERGQLDIDVPIARYIADYPNAERITARQLMSHTSGIPNYLGFSEFWETSALHVDLDGLLDVFKDRPLAFEPGERYSYSNSGYVVLGYLIEQVSGMTYEQFLQANVFDPLHMDDTGVDSHHTILDHRASGYALSEGELVNTSYLDMYLIHGSGALYSTVEDLLVWEQALYTEKLVGAGTIAEMSTPSKLNDGSETSYGLGFRLGEIHGLRDVGHTGSINGFNTRLTRYTEQKFTVIVFCNSPRLFASDLARDISEIYLSSEMRWEGEEVEGS